MHLFLRIEPIYFWLQTLMSCTLKYLFGNPWYFSVWKFWKNWWAVFLYSIMNTQSNLILNHKMAIVTVSLQPAVYYNEARLHKKILVTIEMILAQFFKCSNLMKGVQIYDFFKIEFSKLEKRCSHYLHNSWQSFDYRFFQKWP